MTQISIDWDTEESPFSTIPENFAFHHKQIEILYQVDCTIEEEELASILSLPRETLIEDLHRIISDCIERKDWFSSPEIRPVLTDENTWMLLHAALMLGELQSKESLPHILEILRQDEAFLELFLSDCLTAYFVEAIYKIGNEDLDTLKHFMLEPGIDTFSKSEVGRVAEQIAYHQPERRPEVIQWYRDVFTAYAQMESESKCLDALLIGLLISSTMAIRATELNPEIETLYKLDYVDQTVCGTLRAYHKEIENPTPFSLKMEMLSVIDRYKWFNEAANFQETDDGYWSDDDDFIEDSLYYEETPPMPITRDYPKIGRNDPCPCGSGKKHKKCCL